MLNATTFHIPGGIASLEHYIKSVQTTADTRIQELVKKAHSMRMVDDRKALEKISDDGYSSKYFLKGFNLDELLDNRYKIIKFQDNGAMANIHLVQDIRTNQIHALKSLREGTHTWESIRRFVREAHALAPLNHPNVVSAVDLGRDQSRPYIVMDYLTEGNFSKLIKQFQKEEIALETMLYYFADLCSGLDYLHTQTSPIIHRDLKPANVLVSSEEVKNFGPSRKVIKLADFGLASILMNGVLTTLSDFGQLLGTPLYSAIPDQINRLPPDGRSDLYSVGIMLYNLITGQLPFGSDNSDSKDTPAISKKSPRGGKTPTMESSRDSNSSNSFNEIIQRHMKMKPDFSVVKSGIPSRLIVLTEKLLSKDPTNRPHCATIVAQELIDIARPKTSINFGVMHPTTSSVS